MGLGLESVEAAKQMAKKETHQQINVGSIMLTTDFATDGKLTKAAWERGYVDLGGVLATKSLIAAIGDSFTGTLPPDADALEAHDNDWWFFKKAMEVGAAARIIHELLFFHN